jgi:hypothetical protein
MAKIVSAVRRALNIYGGGDRHYIWYLYHNV